MSNMSFSYVVE